MHRIITQITAALALRELLFELGVATTDKLDLLPLIDLAISHEIITLKEGQILYQINYEANDAKHLLRFSSRL